MISRKVTFNRSYFFVFLPDDSILTMDGNRLIASTFDTFDYGNSYFESAPPDVEQGNIQNLFECAYQSPKPAWVPAHPPINPSIQPFPENEILIFLLFANSLLFFGGFCSANGTTLLYFMSLKMSPKPYQNNKWFYPPPATPTFKPPKFVLKVLFTIK